MHIVLRRRHRDRAEIHGVRLLVFDDPALSGRYEWLVDERDDVHAAMWALARQAYRRNRRHPPEAQLHEQLRAHGSVDAHPYVPPAPGIA
jgi:hypothetical protein